MADSLSESINIQIQCPKCRHRFAKPISELTPGTSVDCPSCGAKRIAEIAGDDAADDLDNIDEIIARLNRK